VQQSLAQALRELGSRNQKAREAAARALLREAGEPGTVASVLHHGEGGYRPAVLAAIAADESYARQAAAYLGAWHGTVTQHPSTVAFHSHEGGADRLHVIRAQVPPDAMADALRQTGARSFSLRPTDGGTTGFVYDAGGLLDFTPLAARLPGGNAVFSAGTGQRLGQGAGPDAGGGAVAAYRDHIRRAEAAAEGAGAEAQRVPTPARVRLARLPAGAMRAADLRTWQKVVAKMPDDRTRRGALADWLEERGHHHDDLTLDLLRHHDGPVFLARHPRTKKAVAVAGEPVRSAADLDSLRDTSGGDAYYRTQRIVHIAHGPRGIGVAIQEPDRFATPESSYSVDRLRHDGWVEDSAIRHPDFNPFSFHATRQEAIRAAQRHAFGD
jgi:uncharacterized protein (TIGR02996 family)